MAALKFRTPREGTIQRDDTFKFVRPAFYQKKNNDTEVNPQNTETLKTFINDQFLFRLFGYDALFKFFDLFSYMFVMY